MLYHDNQGLHLQQNFLVYHAFYKREGLKHSPNASPMSETARVAVERLASSWEQSDHWNSRLAGEMVYFTLWESHGKTHFAGLEVADETGHRKGIAISGGRKLFLQGFQTGSWYIADAREISVSTSFLENIFLI